MGKDDGGGALSGASSEKVKTELKGAEMEEGLAQVVGWFGEWDE